MFICQKNFVSLHSVLSIKITKKMSEIATKVKSIITDKLGVEESQVTPEASFTNDLGADSLDAVELIMAIEEDFGVTISDEDGSNVKTVGDVVKLIDNN